MPKKNSYLTVTDQFCGAGGSSQGVRNAARKFKGLEVKLAHNHWKLAIETHNTNFPDTYHDCTDVSACDPRRYPSTNILITSPECTNHSLSNGKKKPTGQGNLFDKFCIDPSEERSRATMWDVPRFAEYHNYECIIVENVVDARKWVQYPAWLHAMQLLGYSHKAVYLNSMHCHPTPQSRDRMYVVFWKKGNRAPDIDFRPVAFCPKCSNDIRAFQRWKDPQKPFGKYRQQYVYCCPTCTTIVEPYYYAAFNCIDWSDLGTRIGDRKKPLSPNTLRRIDYGLKKYGRQPFQVVNYSPGYCRSISDSAGTVTAQDHHGIASPFIVKVDKSSKEYLPDEPLHTIVAGGLHHGIVSPFVVKLEHSQQQNVRELTSEFQTQTTRQSMAMITPYIIEMNRTGEAKPAAEHPASTITAGGVNHALLNMPLIVENKGQSNSRPVTDPVGSVTTIPHLGLITNEAWNSFISSYYSNITDNHIAEALGTQRANDSHALVSYQVTRLEDCFYRMLRPHEIKLAMAFDSEYIVLGSQKDQVKQLGNAVTPPAMEWLIERLVESLN